jgi:potassium-transporting ATPase KdpC subunit
MRTHLARALVLTAVLLVLCGVAYPLAGWGLAQVAFHTQANGSVVDAGAGSALIGQPWSSGNGIDERWFQGRPDPDNPLGLNGVAGTSGASNLGPRSSVLVRDVRALVAAWHAVGVTPTSDLVTSSGSGLDPDITPRDALVQIPMIERSRHLDAATLRALVARLTHGAQFGFLGAPYVNVLELNTALQSIRGTGG